MTQKFGFFSQRGYDATGLHPYPDRLRCSWLFEAPQGHVLWIKTVDIEMEQDCSGYVELIDGYTNESMTKFCGRRTRAFRSPTNKLRVNFIGRRWSRFGPTSHARGVKIYFEHVKKPVVCDDDEYRCRTGVGCYTKKETCDGIDQCGDGSDEQGCSPSAEQLAFPANCGQPSIEPRISKLNFKIVGGTAARKGSWPWQVDLRLIQNEPEGHLCGAIVIDGQWILTAAHCFYEYSDIRDWRVYIGKYNKLVKDDSEVIRYIDKLIKHPRWRGGYEQDDIALIKLNAYLPSDNDEIQAICFPNGREDVPQTMTVVTGWGNTINTGFDRVLKQAQLPIIDRQQCREWLDYLDVTDNMVCAGYELGGHDTCQGDSGGPMFLKKNNRWTLVGITSSGSRYCGMCPKQPGVYTRVASYLDWIRQTISSN